MNAADYRERQKRIERMRTISDGLACEAFALNAAIAEGRDVRFPIRAGSLASGKAVDSVRYSSDGLWVTCKNYGGSFSLGNDSRWAELLKIAGVTRDARVL